MEEGLIHEEKAQGYEIEKERQIMVTKSLEEHIRSQFLRGSLVEPHICYHGTLHTMVDVKRKPREQHKMIQTFVYSLLQTF